MVALVKQGGIGVAAVAAVVPERLLTGIMVEMGLMMQAGRVEMVKVSVEMVVDKVLLVMVHHQAAEGVVGELKVDQVAPEPMAAL